jgi:hypothetical protein
LVVRKRVVDANDPNRRFERSGFVFRILDGAGQQIGDPFATASTGRAVFAGSLMLGTTYTLEETFSPITNVQLARVQFEMTRPNQQVRVVNTVTQPNTPYSG